MRYAREKLGDVDGEDDGGGGDDDDDEAPTDHRLLTFHAPASQVRSSPAARGGRQSGPSGATDVCATGDADPRGRRDDPRPHSAAPRRRDAVIRRSACGDRGGGSAPPRIIVVVVGGGGGGDVLANGGPRPTVDRGRIVPETTAGNNGASWRFRFG